MTAAAPSAPQATLLLLVRHGETPTTGTVLPGRAPGLHLSDQGRAQAKRVAERLAGLPVDVIYSSPLERTRESAEPTAACTGLEVKENAGLIECDFGEWTGAALAELAGLPQWQTVQHSPSAFRFPNGESFAQMKAAVAHALGTHLDHLQRIVISPGSVSVISYVEGQAPVVLMVNATLEPLSGLRES